MNAPAVDAARTGAMVWDALATVHDPELDEPVTSLGFVASCRVDDQGTARVSLRLPTFFCAANFAYLMVADARAAVTGVPGVRRAEITLDDHFVSDSINTGVAGGRGFVATFGDLASDELDDLRRDFLRKAVLVATDRVHRALPAHGYRTEQMIDLTLGDVASVPEVGRLRDRRARLGLPSADHDPLLVDPASGAPVDAASLQRHLAVCRLTRTSVEANGELCRGLLRGRYPEATVAVRSASSRTSPH